MRAFRDAGPTYPIFVVPEFAPDHAVRTCRRQRQIRHFGGARGPANRFLGPGELTDGLTGPDLAATGRRPTPAAYRKSPIWRASGTGRHDCLRVGCEKSPIRRVRRRVTTDSHQKSPTRRVPLGW
ncbi:phenolic acid decarboxylase [Rudaeicoccus suwonensis]|uniref:phenolic acid decarboxylase n=1 Tax=Rudaeicoccus suwonensis TaxID=657409 RepID=UPI001FE5BE84|nr:phenolic acid decarboxylase [Rudaeicoccus suwonensis]